MPSLSTVILNKSNYSFAKNWFIFIDDKLETGVQTG